MTPEQREPIPGLEALGCHDGGCPFTRHLGGMRTNGGCRCLDDATTSVQARRDIQRLIQWMRERAAPTPEAEADRRLGAAVREWHSRQHSPGAVRDIAWRMREDGYTDHAELIDAIAAAIREEAGR